MCFQHTVFYVMNWMAFLWKRHGWPGTSSAWLSYGRKNNFVPQLLWAGGSFWHNFKTEPNETVEFRERWPEVCLGGSSILVEDVVLLLPEQLGRWAVWGQEHHSALPWVVSARGWQELREQCLSVSEDAGRCYPSLWPVARYIWLLSFVAFLAASC